MDEIVHLGREMILKKRESCGKGGILERENMNGLAVGLVRPSGLVLLGVNFEERSMG